ncbi:hypothetical protein [Deinococcus radiotolerans]|uniref:Zinc finger CHC2-type domain-containing protein n=1 Tax=Deinococcus radiotolerans TaxID=1309407 RepID=A0ABQ2FQ52_9DEIO|nr:hypothetical protein [Deinococcus radiotolerans]GGL15635.1 hypothetical protein GCM10010844_38210 [Deinococcus radiotolerans]
MAKQDFETRRQRLAKGACPIHGIGLSQSGSFYTKADGTQFAIFSCPRHDCGITVRGNPSTNFWEATPETAALVGEAPDTAATYRYHDLQGAFGAIDNHLAVRAFAYSSETGQSPQALIEAALTAYLDARGR